MCHCERQVFTTKTTKKKNSVKCPLRSHQTEFVRFYTPQKPLSVDSFTPWSISTKYWTNVNISFLSQWNYIIVHPFLHGNFKAFYISLGFFIPSTINSNSFLFFFYITYVFMQFKKKKLYIYRVGILWYCLTEGPQ